MKEDGKGKGRKVKDGQKRREGREKEEGEKRLSKKERWNGKRILEGENTKVRKEWKISG